MCENSRLIQRDVRVDNLFSTIEAIRLQNQIKIFTFEKCEKNINSFSHLVLFGNTNDFHLTTT